MTVIPLSVHTVTVTVNGGGDTPGPSLTTVDAVSAYLSAAADENSAQNPVTVTAALDPLTDLTGLLSAIDQASKYVTLDLSECTSNEEFDVYALGSPWIVSLTLPATAIYIHEKDDTLKNFVLKNIRGDAIVTIGNSAFSRYAVLETADFPLVTTIGYRAFYYCYSLETVDFPLATTIGSEVFWGTGLTLPQNAPAVSGSSFTGGYFKTVIIGTPSEDWV
ncbi:MAG: leucine-rich repeat domain-containing protein [Treponema sp.]|jgi:hypothetical protein|nr:leucine-rich repeat domain-containing protein [Treponema sp.]